MLVNKLLYAFFVDCENFKVGGTGGFAFSFESNYATGGWMTQVRVFYDSHSDSNNLHG